MRSWQSLEERVQHVEQDLAKLKSQVERLRPEGKRMDQITGLIQEDPGDRGLLEGVNPWLEAAGMFRDDPLFDAWQQAIAEYRREADADADAP